MRKLCASFHLVATLWIVCGIFADAHALVYVNMLWDEHLGTFRVQPLTLVGAGVTLNRDYQNAYGTILDLPPGPPFIIQAPIYATTIVDSITKEVVQFGSVTVESGGLGFFEPFVLQFSPGDTEFGYLHCSGPLKIIGSSWDPIIITGGYVIKAGHPGGADPFGSGNHSSTIKNVQFNGPTYHLPTANYNPIQFEGGHATIENCMFQGFGNDLGDIISYYEYRAVPFETVWDFSLVNCRFEGNNTNTHPIHLDHLRRVRLDRNHFVNNTFFASGLLGILTAIDCGIVSIDGNSAENNSLSIMRFVRPTVQDSCYIRTSADLPMASTGITVGKDSALAIGPGSVMKFYHSDGGLRVSGRLWVDAAVLTSWEDDEYGGDTDLKPPPAWIARWNAGFGYNAGIDIDSTGSAQIRNSLIRYGEGALRAENDAYIDSCRFEFSNGFGLWFESHDTDLFTVRNTTIAHTTPSGYLARYGVMLHQTAGGAQTLTLDGVTVHDTESHGVYLQCIGGGQAEVTITDCKILNNLLNGVYATASPYLGRLKIENSLFVGNGGAGIQGANAAGNSSLLEVSNCLIAGNGGVATPRFGAIFSSGIARFIGNTVAYNNQVGTVFSQLDEPASKAINNVFYRNGSYGFNMGDYSQPTLSYNAFWENDEDVYELNFRGPGGAYLRTVEEVQALGGDYATNQHINPIFKAEITGSIVSVAYRDSLETSAIVAAPGTFNGRKLRHAVVNPDTTADAWFWCVFNHGDTIIVLGDITSVAAPGDVFRVFDAHLSEISPLVDAGHDAEATGGRDFEGDARHIDGDSNGSSWVDIGGDEFNPDSVKIRITSPAADDRFRPGDTCRIEWTAEYADSVDIAYWPHVDSAFITLATGLAADAGSYTWVIPDDILASRCKIVMMGDGSSYAESEYFTIKDYILTRYDADSMYEVFAVARDSWPFSNGHEPTLWPSTWWSQFDYANSNDPHTGKPYPFYFAASWVHNAKPSDFPDWPLFVSAFGQDQCYVNTPQGPAYRPSAVTRWADRKGSWGGSCFGLANLNLLAFVDTAGFAGTWPAMAPFDSLMGMTINDPRRIIINATWAKQMGRANIDHTKASVGLTPLQTLQQCRDMLSGLGNDSTRAITLCDWTSNPSARGCHTITPFMCTQDDVQPELWRILVYDNNYPAVTRIIEIDTVQNTWTYSPLGWTGKRYMYLEDPIENYLGPAVLPTARRGWGAEPAADELTIYISAADTVSLESAHGDIYWAGDSLVSTAAGSYPLIDRSGNTFPPPGWIVPATDWQCRFSAVADSIFRLNFAAPAGCLTYARPADTASDSGLLRYVHSEDRLWVYNIGDAPQPYACEKVFMHGDSEIVIGVHGITSSAGDSVSHMTTPEPGLQVGNYGDSANYIVEARLVGSGANLYFVDSSLSLPAHTGHRIVPTQEDLLNDRLKILIDFGNDGSIDDSMFATQDITVDVDQGSHGSILPHRFGLEQNYPNPFNAATVIEYALPRTTDVTLEVFNILGQKVRTLVDGSQPAGLHRARWDGLGERGHRVATGLYFYRLRAGDFAQTKKMLLLK